MNNSTIFFSPSTCGAYLPAIHGSDMPDDVVEVPERYWHSLLSELALSPKRMAAREDGYPVLVDLPAPDAQWLQENERSWRDAQLLQTDGVVARHRDQIEAGVETTLSASEFASVQQYRQQLRDWPVQQVFPQQALRPQLTVGESISTESKTSSNSLFALFRGKNK